jgi:hypothetical protein
MTRQQKLEIWAEREFARNIFDAIISNDDGSLLAYGRYVITQIQPGVCEVRDISDSVTTFGSKKSALSWCAANRYNDLNLARYILQLDLQNSQIRRDIEQRRRVAETSTNTRFRETVLIKLEGKLSFHRSVAAQLEKCIDRAKYLQLRGLQNETARTRRI